MRTVLILLIVTCAACQPSGTETRQAQTLHDFIMPYNQNPAYWQYKGSPVLLLGATNNDNLFQSEDIENQLDNLAKIGGNFIRNTMSSRDSGDVWPFFRLPDGKYDLTRWNNEYWKRFENLLKWTDEKDIIVQLEIWDRFDYSREEWKRNPYNPDNNINYDSTECPLAGDYPEHPSRDLQPFFHTIKGLPGYTDKWNVLNYYQKSFVDKILSFSLNYGNVLYCMDNETSTPPEWGKYWIDYITRKAKEKQLTVFATDMYDHFFTPRTCGKCLDLIQQPEIFTFMDISQINSRNMDQNHWDTLQWIVNERNRFDLRPINCTKVYGGNSTTWGSGSNQDGIERFCRDVIGGCAAVRHHRPPTGNGLNDKARFSIMAVRKIETEIKFWDVEPSPDLLSDRSEDEAYAASDTKGNFIVYFTEGGSVRLDLRDYHYSFRLKWTGVSTGEWGKEVFFEGGDFKTVTAPDEYGWFAVITASD